MKVYPALGLAPALDLSEGPVGMVECDARHAEEQDGREAEHRQVDVQPAHQFGEANAQLAAQ
jgi:hypothetical protein